MSLLTLGNCGFEKGTLCKERYVSFGKLFFDTDKQKADLLIKYLYHGQFVCKPSDQETPYINGDIMVQDGYEDGSQEKRYHWCGWMWTETDAEGRHVYNGIIKIIPIRLIAELAIVSLKDDPKRPQMRDGIWLPVWLTDRDSTVAQKTPNYDESQPEPEDNPVTGEVEDDLPF